MAGKFYAVKKGRKPGIYMSWDACKAQVMGFPNARYKGFKTKAEAEAFLNPDANDKGLLNIFETLNSSWKMRSS